LTQSTRNPREKSLDSGENTEPEKKKKKSKKIVMISLVIVLLVGGFLGYSFITKSFMFAAVDEEVVIEEKIFALDEFVLNLKDESGRRYIKTKMVLSYANDKDQKVLSENIAQIRDLMIGILRSKTADEMMDVSKAEDLKVEIREKTNELLKSPMVVDVYFVDFMIQ
jgi:flagellar FliL protein